MTLFVLAFFPYENSSHMTSYFLLASKRIHALVWGQTTCYQCGIVLTILERLTKLPHSHTLSTPLTCCNNIARRGDFSDREMDTEQPSRCTSSYASTCRRASPRNLPGNVGKKKSTPPRYFESSTLREFPEYHKKIRIRRGRGRHVEAHRTTYRWRGRQQTPS